jgi:nucleotide-binding universal stress UspA family protein
MITLRQIAVATDFEEAAANALAYGRELARRFDARLVVLHVVDDAAARMMAATGFVYDERATDEAVATARQRLETLATEEDRRELRIELVDVVGTNPAREINEFARRSGIDLLIIGTHGRGFASHFFMGSVAEQVVRAAPCPVLTVHAKEHEFIRPDALTPVCHA